jgi:flagellar assembly protein FliH
MNSFTSRTAAGISAAKYLFDTNFDEVGATDESECAATAAMTLRGYSQAEIDTIRAGAFAEGKSAGHAQAQESIERQNADALDAAVRGLAALIQFRAEFEREVARHAAAIGSALVRKLHPELNRRHGLLEIEGLIGRCLERVHDEPRVVVRLNEAMLDELRPRIDEIGRAASFDGRLVLIADDAIAPGDCRVEWADGGLERDCAQLWQDIENVFERSLADTGEPNPTAARA